MKVFRRRLFIVLFSLLLLISVITSARAGVLMQGFYWDTPYQGEWYDHIASKAEELSNAGFTAIWFPSPCKGDSGGYSMGYDVFDHYDLGNYYQQGTTETRFGSKNELLNAINAYHSEGMQVYVDTVMNHMMGGEQEWNPNTNSYTYTRFDYPHDTFEKNYKHFHPNYTHPDNDPPYHSKEFGEDVCYYNDYNYMGNGLKKLGSLVKE